MYVQWNTLLLADILKSFQSRYIEIYKLDPFHTFLAPVKVELELITDTNILLMIGKGIRGGNKEDFDKIKNYNVLCIGIWIIVMDGQC